MYRSVQSEREPPLSQYGSNHPSEQPHPKPENKFNKLLQGFFRESHAYEIILKLIVQTKSVLTLAINSTYVTFRYQERHTAPIVATLMFELTTKAYKILT